MHFVKVEILKYTDDHFPGWVECRLIDANLTEHIFNEKVPVVTDAAIDATTSLPQPGVIGCILGAMTKRQDGSEILTVNTAKPWGIESVKGQTQFEVFSHQIEFRDHLPL